LYPGKTIHDKTLKMRTETKVVSPVAEWTSLDLEGAGIYYFKKHHAEYNARRKSTWTPTSLL